MPRPDLFAAPCHLVGLVPRHVADPARAAARCGEQEELNRAFARGYAVGVAEALKRLRRLLHELREEQRRAIQHAAQPQLDSLTPNGHMTVATVAG